MKRICTNFTNYINPNICMKSQNKYRKFQLQQKNIEVLEKENTRFKRVYSEYENMSDDLWNLENSNGDPVPDDFINAMVMQATYLEEEIEDWLIQFNQNKNEIKS
ncbi:hypothetical protein AB670_03228 [Chryseobacterium sp. MOF25P]|uniref:DUF4298 domain-containing protein n=2 Tax=Chryseobacterium TaxID=59732 RepID=A0AAX2IF04_9FLAO|nr:hypothetical protein AB670_03228 [Chryseobacterium sp. MOF25P]OBW46970.1 hypothetical protein AB671_00893 [Chryseobacterium sp. BGARF1]SKC01445.1 hypothetical protein SAMN05421800_12068 [Chryseobacterium balustinum]SQA86678.1 Uncharacterised protein [Chryseobacterium balustinum]